MNAIIIMDASAKEIAALVLAVQGRHMGDLTEEVTRRIAENLSASLPFVRSST